ncbi:MAG: hypothetical protein ACAH95_17930 [Fimbriimonas sp.]
MWLQIAFERIVNGHETLQPDEIRSVLQVCDAAIERENPQNAFWHQAKAALLSHAGHHKQALQEWLNASRFDIWKDYQAERLMVSQNLLADRTGARQAWQYAFVYHARSEAGATLIERTARDILSAADYKSEKGREIRYATLMNGDLLRNGGRSLQVSSHGANIIELSAYPATLTETPSPKVLWIGRTELLASLAKHGEKGQYEKASTVFSYNDGWRALVLDDRFKVLADQLSMAAVVVAEAPVAAIAVMVFGLTIWLLGTAIARKMQTRTAFQAVPVGIATVLASTLVYALSANIAAAMAVGLSTAFLLVTPANARHVRKHDLGPLFTFVILILAASSALALGAYVIASSGPAVALATALKVPQDYSERPALAGLAAVFIGLICIAGPLWALVHRIATPVVVSSGLRRAGAMMGLGGLLLVVILSPVCVYFDRQLAETLERLVGNEPVYHLL